MGYLSGAETSTLDLMIGITKRNQSKGAKWVIGAIKWTAERKGYKLGAKDWEAYFDWLRRIDNPLDAFYRMELGIAAANA